MGQLKKYFGWSGALLLTVGLFVGCGQSQAQNVLKAKYDTLQQEYQRLATVEKALTNENADLKQKLTQSDLRVKYLEQQIIMLKKGGGEEKQ